MESLPGRGDTPYGRKWKATHELHTDLHLKLTHSLSSKQFETIHLHFAPAKWISLSGEVFTNGAIQCQTHFNDQ